MKTLILPGPKRELGVRLNKESVIPAASGPPAACTPQITGLVLPMDYNATEICRAVQTPSSYSCPYDSFNFIAVKLDGDTCGLPVTWRTDWEPGDYVYPMTYPLFFDFGQVGVVAWTHKYALDTASGLYYYKATVRTGVVRVWATCNGQEYGPVTITLSGGLPT